MFRSRQFLLFLVTGGLAAAVNFASRIVYNRWTTFSVAVVLAYLTGMVAAYVLARVFVFRETRQTMRRSIAFFVVVNAFAVLQTWCISLFLAYSVLPRMGIHRFADDIAHAIGIMVPVFSSYVGHRRWTFRE